MHKASALADPVSKTYSLVINNEMKFTKLRLSMRNVDRDIHLRQHSTNVILKCNYEWTIIYKLYSNRWEPSNDNDEKFYPVIVRTVTYEEVIRSWSSVKNAVQSIPHFMQVRQQKKALKLTEFFSKSWGNTCFNLLHPMSRIFNFGNCKDIK